MPSSAVVPTARASAVSVRHRGIGTRVVAPMVLSALLAGAQAPAASAETMQDFLARGGVQVSGQNLSSPAPGVSRVRLVQGEMDGAKVRAPLSAMSEATLTYKVRVPRDVHENGLSSRDLKMPGLAGLPEGRSQWDTSTGGSLRAGSWSVRLHARRAALSRVGYPWWDIYFYAPYGGGKHYSHWGLMVPMTEGLNGSGMRLRIPADRWFEVRIRVKMNTPGVNNGELDVWLDGRQGVGLRDIRWREAGVHTPINQFIAEVFYNQPGAPRNGYIDFADFKVTQGAGGPGGGPIIGPVYPRPTPPPPPPPPPPRPVPAPVKGDFAPDAPMETYMDGEKPPWHVPGGGDFAPDGPVRG
ncbi:polysaccharide lyase [Kineococcus xinjiangensis]|nr:hypothetical protein [Kineococcus xinjiangensis]